MIHSLTGLNPFFSKHFAFALMAVVATSAHSAMASDVAQADHLTFEVTEVTEAELALEMNALSLPGEITPSIPGIPRGPENGGRTSPFGFPNGPIGPGLPGGLEPGNFPGGSGPSTSGSQSTADKVTEIINVGRQVWSIVKENKPVVNVVSNAASAIPKDITSWDELQSWQAPASKLFRINVKSWLFGMSVIDYVVRIQYAFGGQTANGKGAYLNQVTAIPYYINIGLGYTLNSDVSVPLVMNVGTRENPVAGMQLQLRWSVETALQTTQHSEVFFIRGDTGKTLVNSNGEILN